MNLVGLKTNMVVIFATVHQSQLSQDSVLPSHQSLESVKISVVRIMTVQEVANVACRDVGSPVHQLC